MWVLVSDDDPARRHELLSGREYTIGRKDCDILIEEDMSISRKHAAVSVSHPENQVVRPQSRPVLTFSDRSRLGSLVGEQRVTQDQAVVSHGTLLVFGTAGISKYRALYEPLITTTSCLDTVGKKQTRQLIGRLGGHVISEWKAECDVLVMNLLSITIKAICALITQKPIVCPRYLEELVKSVEGRKPHPDPTRFLPPLAESQLDPTLVSFSADEQRQTVFQGQMYIFLTAKQLKKLSIAVELGGGTPMLLEVKSADNVDLIMSPGSRVMSCDLDDQSQNLTKEAQNWIQHVNKLLSKHNKRTIHESEIGYAVLYCTTDKYCNPDAEAGPPGPVVPVAGQTLSQFDLTASELRAPDTQPRRASAVSQVPNTPKLNTQVTVKTEPLSQVATPQPPENSIRGSRKRARGSDEDETEAPSKKPVVKHELLSPPTSDQKNTATKSEKITPIKPAAAVKQRSPSPAQQRDGRRNTRKSSPSPEPSTSPAARRNTRNSPAPPSPGRRNTRRSPSPAPQSERRRNIRKMSPDFGDESPVSKTKVKQEVNRQRNRRRLSDDDEDNNNRGRHSDNDDEDDLFSFGSRRSRKGRGQKRRSPSPFAIDEEEKVQTIPDGAASSARQTSPVTKRQTSPSPSASRRQKSPAPSERIMGRPVKAEKRPAKIEVVSGEDDLLFSDDEEEVKSSTDVKPSTSRDIKKETKFEAPISGFLSTKQPVKAQAPVDPDIQFDAALPTDVVQVSEASLIRRPPKVKVTTDSNRWKGKVVRNFKKFSKIPHSGSHDIPTVIGGNDLVAHDRTQNKELEEWFRECLENESQRNQSQREDDDLFSFGSRNVGGSRSKAQQAKKGRWR